MATNSSGARSRGKRKAPSGGAAGRRSAAAVAAAAPAVDADTAAALTLYNTYLEADREQQAHERAVRKAEKAKDEAAAVVRKLNELKTPAAETAAAEAEYRKAVETLRRVRDGESPAEAQRAASDTEAGDDAEDSEEADPDEADETDNEADETVNSERDGAVGGAADEADSEGDSDTAEDSEEAA